MIKRLRKGRWEQREGKWKSESSFFTANQRGESRKKRGVLEKQ